MALLGEKFHILTVCTGNICRSPVAERLLQAGLDSISPGTFSVRSAGTGALVGEPMQPPSAALVKRQGGTDAGFRARQLTPEVVAGIDLVLTMTVHHRGLVLDVDPTLLRKTFTVREFSSIIEEIGSAAPSGATPGMTPQLRQAARAVMAGRSNADRWRELQQQPAQAEQPGAREQSTGPTDRLLMALKNAAATRAKLGTAGKVYLDVVDPYRRSDEVWRQMADELLPAIEKIIKYTGGHIDQFEGRRTAADSGSAEFFGQEGR